MKWGISREKYSDYWEPNCEPMFRKVREIYCIVKWGLTGINPCQEARRLGIEMANKGLAALGKNFLCNQLLALWGLAQC